MRGIYVVPPGRVVHSTSRGKKCSESQFVFSVAVMFLVFSICLAATAVTAQDKDNDRERGLAVSWASLDPGARPGPVNPPITPGNPIKGLTPNQLAAFQNGLQQFIEVEGVALTGPGNGGLGPAYNSDSCSSCHLQPAPGGSSPSMSAFPFVNDIKGQNPQFTVGQKMGGTNSVPFFVTANGPVREARLKSDGGVHDLFTIAGRTDVSNPPNLCELAQPDFAAEAARGNLVFRIPTPVFGAGLIENISDQTILDNVAKSASRRLGIAGVVNRSGNDGSITRFGWKAQNKSLLMFAGEAYNVEMGITNELFPNERGYPGNPLPAACIVNPTPEDPTVFDPNLTLSDIQQFVNFMRFLEQPAPACGTGTGIDCASAAAGQIVFTNIGCANCHTPSLSTATSDYAPAALSGVQANLFSDLALHHMGIRLADGVTQGNAGPDMFRTSPLWGLGQRVFFLHDGRTSNLVHAIVDHASFGSEANQVVVNFELLSLTDKQNLILFLRSL